jgi:hypothetical protein
MLSSVPEVPLATCTGAVSPVVTAGPRAGGHAEQAWPVPGWVRHRPGWVRHRPGWVVSGLGQARAELGTAGLTWKGPRRSRAELAGYRNGLSMGHAMEGGHRPGHHGRAAPGPGRPTPWPSRERTGQTERFVPERTDGQARPWRQRPKASPRRAGQPAPRMADTAAGPSTPTGPGHARGEPDRYRVGIGGSRVIIPLPGSPPQRRSTGKQQPGPPKLRCSGLSRHSHLTGHQGDKSLASESAWV